MTDLATDLRLEHLHRALTLAGEDGLRVFAEAVMHEAQANIGVGDPAVDPAPLIALRDAAHITPDGDGFVLSFDTVYAAKQHEDQHLQHPRGGGSKYLERALTTLAPAAEQIVGSEVHKRFARGL